MVRLSNLFKSPIVSCRWPSTPSVRRPSVWPLPSSLATTKGIEFSFFSSGYLDVSLPRVPSVNLWIQLTVTGHYPGRVPPFGNLRINAYLQLPSAYRSLSRPSSAISAMASTLRSCSLDLALPQHPFLRLLRKVLQPLCLFFIRLISQLLSILDDWNLTSDFTSAILALVSTNVFPLFSCAVILVRLRFPRGNLVGWSGLEPPTSRLSGVCSNQLSYQPMWWRISGSNR